ncbi:hypothetical protein LCGC14_2499700 [marine sediment metagenome]|uniref:DUF3168 domain-containing protein n=1 Tax=marine sediment metagenome TaxID=412755 RepID=A0A0F9DE18_9ZZZZ
MADVYQSLYGRLSGFAGLTALVGTRIFPMAAGPAKPAFPYVTYMEVSTLERRRTMGLPISHEVTAQFRFDLYTKTTEAQSGFTACVALEKQVRLAIDNFSDSVVDAVMFTDLSENVDSQEGLFHRVLDFAVTYIVQA